MSLYRNPTDQEKRSFYSYPSRYQGDEDSREHEEREERDEDEGCHRHEDQRHVHEVQGSVEIAEREEDPHNHRFATVTGEAIPIGDGDHVHNVIFRTDFYENHFHEFRGTTGGMIKVGDRHVHFLESETTKNDGHRHEFRLSTFMNDPIGEEES